MEEHVGEELEEMEIFRGEIMKREEIGEQVARKVLQDENDKIGNQKEFGDARYV